VKKIRTTTLPVLGRRTLLRGAGTAFALPLLQAMLPARKAHAAPRTKRFIAMFSANGTIPKNWTPTGTETAFTLSPILSPLEPLKSKVIVLQGIDQQGGGAGDGHQNGMAGWLTGQPTNPGPFKGGCGQNGGWANGPSLDQVIAKEVAKTVTTKFKSLELGVLSDAGGGTNWSRMCYAGPDQPLPPEINPVTAFSRLFGDLTTTPGMVDQAAGRRKSVLDGVMGQYTYLKGRLGADDGRKLDAHFQAVREVESRLGAVTGGTTTACSKPPMPGAISATANDSFPTIGKLQMDLLVMALACDLTRVASLQWSRAVSPVRFTWLTITRGHHDISHDGDTNTVSVDQLTQINRWFAQQLYYLMDKLNQVVEPEGTLLDNSAILWGNELAKGNAHSRNDAPYVLAGGAGGGLQTGRFLSYTGTARHNDLLVSVANALDVPLTTFGNPAWCTGPLPRLR
jgi:hypothetical protein